MVNVDWYNNDQTAFHLTYKAGWTWADHHQAINQIIRDRRDKGIHQTFALIDMRRTVPSFGEQIYTHYQDPPEGSKVVVIIDSPFMRTVAQFAIRVRSGQDVFHIVGTLTRAAP